MNSNEIDKLISRLDGFIDALSSITRDRAEARYSACAYSTKLDLTNIDAAIKDLISDNLNAFKNDFPESEVPTYIFKKAESITKWTRLLHNDLEHHLLPKEYQESISEPERLKSIQYILAWQVMEMLRLAMDDFESKVIYKINYETSDSEVGVFFVIPLKKTNLILHFGASL